MSSSNTIRFILTLTIVVTGYVSAAETTKTKATEQTKAQIKQVNETCKQVQQGSPQEKRCVQQVQEINKQREQQRKSGGSK